MCTCRSLHLYSLPFSRQSPSNPPPRNNIPTRPKTPKHSKPPRHNTNNGHQNPVTPPPLLLHPNPPLTPLPSPPQAAAKQPAPSSKNNKPPKKASAPTTPPANPKASTSNPAKQPWRPTPGIRMWACGRGRTSRGRRGLVESLWIRSRSKGGRICRRRFYEEM